MNIILGTALIIGVILSIIYSLKLRKDFDRGLDIAETFNKEEKIIVFVIIFFGSLVAGSVFYYLLRSRMPKKASYANNLSWIMFFGIPISIFLLSKIGIF